MGHAWRGKYVRIGAAFECLPFAYHWTKVSVRYSQYVRWTLAEALEQKLDLKAQIGRIPILFKNTHLIVERECGQMDKDQTRQAEVTAPGRVQSSQAQSIIRPVARPVIQVSD
jgi:hypothetical protein